MTKYCLPKPTGNTILRYDIREPKPLYLLSSILDSNAEHLEEFEAIVKELPQDSFIHCPYKDNTTYKIIKQLDPPLWNGMGNAIVGTVTPVSDLTKTIVVYDTLRFLSLMHYMEDNSIKEENPTQQDTERKFVDKILKAPLGDHTPGFVASAAINNLLTTL